VCQPAVGPGRSGSGGLAQPPVEGPATPVESQPSSQRVPILLPIGSLLTCRIHPKIVTPPNLPPTCPQLGPNLPPTCPQLGCPPTWDHPQLGSKSGGGLPPTWGQLGGAPNLGASWGYPQLGGTPNLPPTWDHPQLGPNLGPTWARGKCRM